MPTSFIFLAVSSVTRKPHGAITILKPSFVPCAAISHISSLSIGSPPVRIMIKLGNAFATSSRNARHSSVFNSLGYGPNLAAARQWMQSRLHDRVTSHAMSLGSHFFVCGLSLSIIGTSCGCPFGIVVCTKFYLLVFLLPLSLQTHRLHYMQQQDS